MYLISCFGIALFSSLAWNATEWFPIAWNAGIAGALIGAMLVYKEPS